MLAHGTLPVAIALVALATALSSLAAIRVSQEVRVDELLFGERRSAAIDLLLTLLGTERTSVVVYLVQRSFDAVVVATGATPIFVWLLGSSAVHASARLAGLRRDYLPLLVLFGYATALTRIPADAASAALGVDGGPVPQLAGLVGALSLVWLGAIVWRAIQSHYVVSGGRALSVLIVAIVLFYLVPLALILVAAVAIVLAAIVLEYVPGG